MSQRNVELGNIGPWGHRYTSDMLSGVVPRFPYPNNNGGWKSHLLFFCDKSIKGLKPSVILQPQCC